MSAKARVNNSSMAMPPFKPDYRIGDLLWVRERNGKVWWPAMVTYDPNLGIFYRTKPPRRIEYHVQYFGITAIRGWVFSKSIEPVNDPMEKSFPQKGCSQKVRGEYKTAIKELQEALSLNHKERKLRFIFSFNPLPRSKKARKDSTSSRASVSSERSTGSHNSKQASSTTAKEIPRTSGREKEDIKPNVARTTVIASTAPQQSSSTRSRGSTSLNSEVSASQKSSGTTTSELLTSSRRKRSVSGKPRDQESARSTRNQSSKRHREKDKSGHCWCPDCSTQTISQDVKKLRCSSPPVEARTLNLDADLNNSVIPLELCEQQTPTPTPAPPAAPAPQPAFFFQPTFTPLGGLTYPPCMYMSLQYASLWPSGTGMPATPAAAAAAALGQTPPQVYTGLNMVYVDAQRQLLGADGFQNSTRMLPFSPPSLPSASFNTSPLLAPPAPAAPIAAIGSPPAAAAATFGHPTSPPLSLSLSIKEDTVAAPSQSILSPRQPSLPTPTPAPAPVISDMVATSTSKRPRRSNVRYGSSSNSRRSSDASVVEQASSSGGATVAIASEQPIPLRSRSHSLRSALGSSSTEPDIKIMPSNGHMMGSIGSCSHNIRSAILTPPTSSSEDSPSIDLDFERPILPNHLLANVAASSNSDLHTVSSSEETDSVKLEIGRKRKRESHSNKNVEKEGPSFKSGVCSICDDEDTELLVCGGHCYGMFHLDCLGLMQPPTCKFVCDECLVSSSKCFACGKSNGEVVKCSKPRCTKLYHLSCIKGNKLFSFDQRRSSSFTCPLHVCARCESIGGSSHVGHSNLLQCTMCPLALHKPDCLIAGCEVVNQTHMVCYQHIKITKSVQLYSHLNLNTCLDCGKTGSLFCCDVCSAAYHMECLDEDDRPANDSDSWKCPNCTVHDLSVYGSLVLCKFGVWRCVCSVCGVCVCVCVCEREREDARER